MAQIGKTMLILEKQLYGMFPPREYFDRILPKIMDNSVIYK